MNIEDLMKQLGVPAGVGIIQAGGEEGMSGETALIKEIMGTHQRCVSKMRAVIQESGKSVDELTSKANLHALALGYLVGCINLAERVGEKVLPHNFATLLSTTGFVGSSDMLEPYYKVLGPVVAQYLDSTAISDIQDHDQDSAIGIATARRKMEEKVMGMAEPAIKERKGRNSASTDKTVN